MSPVAGLVRLRKHQFARQFVFGTKVAATRAYPFSGTPDVDLGWTDSEVDAGALDDVAPPYRVAGDFTAPLTDPALAYNTIPLLMCGIFGGGEDPTGAGTAKTWTHEPGSTTPDDFDPMTYEFGDDVTTDWYQFGDGILESLEITGPDGLGPLSTSMGWRFGSAASKSSTDSPVTGTVPTPSLDVDTTAALVYLKDLGIYIASTTAGLAAGQVTDALHSFSLRITQEIDQKRYANGSQSFGINAYGRGRRLIELTATWAKTADTVGTGSETDAWFSDEAVSRYVRLKATSKSMAEGIIPYSWDVSMPMRYRTREEGEIGGNTTVALMGRAFYDPDDFNGAFKSIAINQLTAADLGATGS